VVAKAHFSGWLQSILKPIPSTFYSLIVLPAYTDIHLLLFAAYPL